MGRICEFKPRESNLAPTPKNEKREDRVEDKRPLLERLDLESRKLFEKGPGNFYDDLGDGEDDINEAKLEKTRAEVKSMSDDEIVEALSEANVKYKKYREIVATDPELFQAYQERIMGEKK